MRSRRPTHRALPPPAAAPTPGRHLSRTGRLLWRSAMYWGKEYDADYQLLQTAAGGASDRLCRSEGLADLGFVCTATV
ncbi:hypothetical protein BU198_10530 [Streptomyces sp. CBMA156]|nr:hypothetical protein [Streptomyces sp. CBMA156]